MPLKIRVKPEAKIIAGGAVLKNVGKHSAELLILSDSPVLRDDFVLGLDQQNQSDASNVYLVMQMLYLFRGKGQQADKLIIETVRSFGTVYPKLTDTVNMIIGHLEKGEGFKALRLGQKLLEAERADQPMPTAHAAESFHQQAIAGKIS